MKGFAVALACVLITPAALAQQTGSNPPGHLLLPVAFPQTLPLPGESEGPPQFEVTRSTNRIVQSDRTFEEKLAEILVLTESPEYADDATLVQAASGIGLRWVLRNPTEWAGNEAAVAQLLSTHASHGGIMFAEMVQTHDILVWHLPSDRVSQIRDQIIAAYRLRLENPCAECADDPFGFVVDPESFNDSMRARVQLEADAHRAALATVVGWADDD